MPSSRAPTTTDTTMASLEADGQPHRFFGPDLEQSRLRGIVEALGAEVTRLEALTGRTGDVPSSLMQRYVELEAALALGPDPEVRSCPACGTIGMKRATVCGNCWTALSPAP